MFAALLIICSLAIFVGLIGNLEHRRKRSGSSQPEIKILNPTPISMILLTSKGYDVKTREGNGGDIFEIYTKSNVCVEISNTIDSFTNECWLYVDEKEFKEAGHIIDNFLKQPLYSNEVLTLLELSKSILVEDAVWEEYEV